MRVLAIAPTSFFAEYGCHVRIRGQLEGVRARGHDVLLVTYPGGRDIASIPTIRAPWPTRGSVRVGPSWAKLALDAALAPTALRAARRFRPDVIHAYLHEGALIGAAIAALLRLPLLFDYQGSLTAELVDHGFLPPRSPWLRPLRRLEGWIDGRPQAVLASSQHAARLLASGRGFAVAPKVVALPDAVDPAHFRPAGAFDPAALATLRARLGIPAGRRIIAYLGLLAAYQGTDLLLDAMAILARRRADAHLLLMGFPAVERYRMKASALGLADRVTLTGPVRYEAAPAYLALGQVAVAPKSTTTEGSGKVLAYMASALPVAALDTPVHREYLGDLGIYAALSDAEALAGALAYLLDNTRDATLRGEALRDRAAGSFTWQEMAARIDRIYRCAQAGRVTSRTA